MRIKRRKAPTVDPSDLRRALKAFAPALGGQRLRIASTLGLALAATSLELLKPWPITWVIDAFASPAPGSTAAGGPTVIDPAAVDMRSIVLFAGVAVVVSVLLGVARERLQLGVAKVSRKATVRIRSDVFEHIQRLELSQHQRHYSGDLVVRLMGDVNMVRDLLFPSWVNVVSRGSVLIGGSLVFAIVDWRLFLVALIPLPLLWVSLERTSSAVKTAAGKSRRKEGAIASTAAESIRQVGLIKAFSAERRTADEFRSTARSAERATMAAARHAARMMRLTEILTGGGIALVLVMGASRVRAGLITPGELVLAISYTTMIYKPLRKLSGEGARIAKATACSLRVLDLLEQPIEDSDSGRAVRHLDGDIEFVDIGHSYHDGRASLTDFNAHVTAGSLTAIIGENGTGKSTLLSLLLRLHRPTAGKILIGGTPIDEMQLSSYREQIAYVPQELALFGGSIRDNIAFGKPGATDAEIEAAAASALLTPVLDRLPDGIDTVLDEDGSSLSGGQARRVMLARAAVRDAGILVLDEPLTGLDPEARDLVARAIRNIARGRTTLVIHHGDIDELGPDACLRLVHKTPPARHLEVVNG